MPPSLPSAVIDSLAQVAWSGSGCGSTSNRLGFLVGTRAPIRWGLEALCALLPMRSDQKRAMVFPGMAHGANSGPTKVNPLLLIIFPELEPFKLSLNWRCNPNQAHFK
jgi:hypothetical protein